MLVVPVETNPSFVPGAPEVLFSGDYAFAPARAYDYDATRDRFVMMKPDESSFRSTELAVVVNWFEELKRLAPHR